jgi:hypothetical protein
MIEKFATMSGEAPSEFLDLNHTSRRLTRVSLLLPKFAHHLVATLGELRNRDTRTTRSSEALRGVRRVVHASRTLA